MSSLARNSFIGMYLLAAVGFGTVFHAFDVARCSPNASKPFAYVVAGAVWPLFVGTWYFNIIAGGQMPMTCAAISTPDTTK